GDPVEILPAAVFALQRQQSAADRDLVAEREKTKAGEGFREMQRRREDAGFQNGRAAARFDEEEFAMEPDKIAHLQTAVEIEEIDAAPKENVLAIIDGFSGLVRRCYGVGRS